MAGLKYWLWLATRKRLGLQGMRAVLEQFGTPERAYFADPAEYRLLPPVAAAALRDRSMDAVDRIRADCQRIGARIMTIQDADYPERLRQLADAPCLLYLKGKLPDFDESVAIGVVGARRASQYGRTVASRLGLELSRGGATVVSGIATGIDGCAVRGALQAGGAPVCVVAGGLDVPYPKEHSGLYSDVAAAGLLISEYPPGTPNRADHFPTRNRIISGLSLGVVVVEAREHGSGAMITAERALDQNRDVFAVPGNVDAENSRGCIRLIQQGAKPVLNAEDVLVEYRDLYPARLVKTPPMDEGEIAQRLRPAPEAAVGTIDKKQSIDYSLNRRTVQGLTDDQIAILHALAEKPQQADELVERTQIPARRVLSALTVLQIDGCVEEKPGRRFACLVKLIEE